MTRLTVDFDWQVAGRVELDLQGKLRFPRLGHDPGVYRMWIESAADRPEVYFGQAVDLRGRMSNYRNPGRRPTQLRINAWLNDHLRSASVVTLSLVSEAFVKLDAGEFERLDMSRLHQRVIVEAAAITATLVENVADAETPIVVASIQNKPGAREGAW